MFWERSRLQVAAFHEINVWCSLDSIWVMWWDLLLSMQGNRVSPFIYGNSLGIFFPVLLVATRYLYFLSFRTASKDFSH